MTADDARLFAPATARNREPILSELRRLLPAEGSVLEVASGSGEHAVFFAKAMPGLTWRPSDPDPTARASIAAWTAAEGAANVAPPLDLDAASSHWPAPGPFDAVVSANMIHIAPWDAALGLLAGAARILAPGGLLILYGPFLCGGVHTAPSNAAFDDSLRLRDPAWGVRDIDAVAEAGAAHGLVVRESVDMPANNLIVVLARA